MKTNAVRYAKYFAEDLIGIVKVQVRKLNELRAERNAWRREAVRLDDVVSGKNKRIAKLEEIVAMYNSATFVAFQAASDKASDHVAFSALNGTWANAYCENLDASVKETKMYGGNSKAAVWAAYEASK